MDSNRSKTEVWGIGPMITADDKIISGKKLPSNLQTLRCFMANYNDEVKTEKRMHPPAMRSAAKATLETVRAHFQKASVPMQEDKNCIRIILDLYKYYVTKIRSINKTRRDTPTALKKVQEFKKGLSKTIPLWPRNARTLIGNSPHPAAVRDRNIAEDLAFFNSMLTDRTKSYGGADSITTSLKKRPIERQQKLNSYHQRLLFDKDEVGSNASAELVPDDDDAPA